MRGRGGVRKGLAGAVLGAVLAGCAGGAPAPGGDPRDIERGRALYENHCTVCHTAKVHRRVPRLPADADELRRIVLLWVRYEGLAWSDDDVADVVYYVDRVYYRYGQ